MSDISPLAIPPKAAARLLGYGLTHFYKLLDRGEIRSFRDGGARRVLVESIHEYVARKLAADSQPVRRGPGRPKKSVTP
jgi:excisionase family DNA binding protein